MTCKDVAAWDDAKAVSHFFIARHFSSLSGAFSLNLIRFIPMAGVVYSFPSLGCYDKYLEKNHPKSVDYLRQKILGKHAFWVIEANCAAWTIEAVDSTYVTKAASPD